MENSEYSKKIKELYDNNIKMLFSWGTLNCKQKLKRYVRKYLLRKAVAPIDHWFWPQAMLAEGIMAVVKSADRECEDRQRGLSTLEKYYNMWIASGQKIYYVDNAMHGITLLDLYEETGQEKYLKAADKLADYLMGYPLDEQGNLVYRLRDSNKAFADALGMICPFLCRYGVLVGKQEMTELGIRQLTNFLQYGMDQSSGLPYHGFDSKTGVKHGNIGWGRAVGWMMMGLCGSLKYLPENHPQYGLLMNAVVELEKRVMNYQRADGGFSWLIQAVEGSADTSATAMIMGSVLDKSSEVSAWLLKSAGFLLQHIENGNVCCASGECEGFGQYPQRYGVYPWGNGSVLKLFKMMENSEKT